jgi:hypothetical protein
MYSKYETQFEPLSPVAIKLGQHKVHAPYHGTWGLVTCDKCKEEFAIGPNLIHGTDDASEERSVAQFETILADDHEHGNAHSNSYELPD